MSKSLEKRLKIQLDLKELELKLKLEEEEEDEGFEKDFDVAIEYEKGRRCPICQQKLSILNPGPNCFSHTKGMSKFRYNPITLCIGYKTTPDFSESMLRKPGTEAYNRMAFRKELIEE